MIDLMILFVLLKRDLTMYAVHKRIEENFLPYTNPSFGAIKPALVRLEKNGFLTSAKIMSDGGKLSVFYSITKDGMIVLKGAGNDTIIFATGSVCNSDGSPAYVFGSGVSNVEVCDLQFKSTATGPGDGGHGDYRNCIKFT